MVRLHGIPRSIVSDRDKVFLSHFWIELFRLQGSKLRRSTACHPQTDGQSEVVNRCLETYLRCFSYDKPKSLSRWLPWAEYWYNTSYHDSIATTPFKAVYGRDPPPLLRYGSGVTAIATVEQQLQERDAMLEELKAHLIRAQSKMKKTVDQHRRDIHFEVGDMVYLKLQPYRRRSLAQKANEKLAPRYFGPYKVIQRIGPVAYKLELPDSTTIHPVFHVSQLKRALGKEVISQPLPPILDSELEWLVEPELVLDARQQVHNNSNDWEVLIKWQNLPDFEASWEPANLIASQFPDFHLEDKVSFAPRGIDRPPIRFTYARRKKRMDQGESMESNGLCFVTGY